MTALALDVPTIYFAQAGEGGPVKIGWTAKPRRRFATLQTDCWLRVDILASIPGSMRDEAALHERFRAHRIRGEWFRPVPELLAFAESVETEKVRLLLAASLRDVG